MDPQYSYSAINNQHNTTHSPPRDDSPSPEPGYTPNNMASAIEFEEFEVSPLSNRGHFQEMFSEPRSSEESPEQPLPVPNEPISEKKRPGRRFDRVGSWAWEAGGCALSIVSTALLIGFLAYIDNREYASWQRSVSPNTVVSIISTVAKASMLVPVSSCISQLKWTRYQNPTPLYHMQVLDQASRGPVGALESLWTVAPGLATFGASLMVLAVAFDPFAQQILSYPSRRMESNDESSFVQYADQYWPDWARSVAPKLDILNTSTRGLEPSMQAAIFSGLTDSDISLRPVCPSGDCEYEDFVTLGVCSQCKDVTDQASQNCVPSTNELALYTQEWMAEIPLECTYTTPSGASISPGIWVDDAKWLSQDNYSAFAIPNLWSAVSLSNGSITEGDRSQMVSFLAAKYEGRQTTWTSKNNTMSEDKPTLTECSVSLCERKYTQTKDSAENGDSNLNFELVEAQDLYFGKNIQSNITNIWLPTLVSPNNTEQLSPNSNFTIENSTWTDLSRTLIGLFNSTLFTGDAQYIEQFAPGMNSLLALWASTNLTDTMNSMADSMTDHIRSSTSSKNLSGTTFHTETYIHVRWPWIALPVILIILSTAFLMVVSVENRKYSTFLWKSSVIPLLFGKLQIGSEHQLDVLQSVTDIQEESKKIKIAVECEAPFPEFVER